MNLTNIEIKVKPKNFDQILEKVIEICQKPESIDKQVDTFYYSSVGRLKLREYNNSATLIYYNRPDSKNASKSDIDLYFVNDAAQLKIVLNNALGIRGIVKKRRTLFIYGQTRIHFDEVEGLGNFIELEVVLNDNQTEKDGTIIVDELIKLLKIDKNELIDVAYIDLLEGEKS